MNEERRIIYLCSTPLHLMNCIIAQMTVNRDIPADIVFEDVSDFSGMRERLMQHSVFENSYHFEFLPGKARYQALPAGAERHEAEYHPSRVFDFPDFSYQYTDLCANIDSFAPKFFYYGMIEKGMFPKVHFVSEGTATYSLDFSNTARDGMDHNHYGEHAFTRNIANLYCYMPELYTGGSDLVHLVQMPNFSALPNHIRDVLKDVFGFAEPIKEKIIFFEGTFWKDGMLTNEMHLFLAIANRVGWENIIVKRHPRNSIDRFTPLGFKVMATQSVPWEVMIKDLDLSKKVLVSVASFSSFSAQEMYGRQSLSLLLKDLMQGRVYFLEDPGYKRFFKQAETIYNSERITSWSPKTMCELELTLDVLKEKVGGWES